MRICTNVSLSFCEYRVCPANRNARVIDDGACWLTVCTLMRASGRFFCAVSKRVPIICRDNIPSVFQTLIQGDGRLFGEKNKKYQIVSAEPAAGAISRGRVKTTTTMILLSLLFVIITIVVYDKPQSRAPVVSCLQITASAVWNFARAPPLPDGKRYFFSVLLPAVDRGRHLILGSGVKQFV